MNKVLFISTLLFLLIIACHHDNGVKPAENIPVWLDAKIDSMSGNLYYAGSVICRYTWNKAFVYHIDIPVSSCAYCELYDQRGAKIQITNDAQFKDFLNNKTNAVVIWKWPNTQ
jgi:hypothetical protein